MTIFVGIDPGLSGFVCSVTVRDSEPLAVAFEPLRYNATRTMLMNSFDETFSEVERVTIEKLGYMGVAKGNSLFTMAQCFGALTQAVEQAYIGEVMYVRPADWKRKAGLSGKDKKESITLFHSLVMHDTKVTHDQAEAFLIAVGYIDGEDTHAVEKRLLERDNQKEH